MSSTTTERFRSLPQGNREQVVKAFQVGYQMVGGIRITDKCQTLDITNSNNAFFLAEKEALVLSHRTNIRNFYSLVMVGSLTWILTTSMSLPGDAVELNSIPISIMVSQNDLGDCT